MFTGIITDLGEIEDIVDDNGRTLWIAAPFDLDTIAIGASVAHSGICLTVVEKRTGQYRVFASGETLSRTTIGGWQVGDRVNLEHSLKLGDELGGHLVFGHVDGCGELVSLERDGAGYNLRFSMPQQLAPLIAVKGSVAVDGISLTVTYSDKGSFGVSIIPHTWEVTTLKDRKLGDRINLEVDMLARYVGRQLEFTKGMTG